MSFRGRGRGRGGWGGGGFRSGEQKSFTLFPDIELPDSGKVTPEKELVAWYFKLKRELKDMPYFLEGTASEKNENMDIERYSDKTKRNQRFKRGFLEDYIKLQPGYFPSELVQGTKRRTQRKVQWNTNKGLEKMDAFEELEEKSKGREPKGQKETEDEEGEDQEVEEEEEEYSDEGDYEQNEDFDDDEDDYNVNNDGDDEPYF